MKILLFTYPRSGQHLLKAHMEQKLDDISIHTTHLLTCKDYDYIITILRDPIKSVGSFVAMNCYFDKNITEKDEEKIIQYSNWAKLKYIATYEEMIKECDLFVLYDELVSDPNNVIKKIAKSLDIKTKDINFNQSVIVDKPSNKHLVSSKNTKYYDLSLELVAKNNTDAMYNVFDLAYGKSL
jgi:hypothetical protein